MIVQKFATEKPVTEFKNITHKSSMSGCRSTFYFGTVCIMGLKGPIPSMKKIEIRPGAKE